MKAFLAIADAMPKVARAITAPASQPGRPIILTRGVRDAPVRPLAEARDAPDTHIEPWMVAAFADLVRAHATDAPFALISCRMNGHPAAVIACCRQEDHRTHVLPLFLAVQPWMHFSDEPPD